MCAVCIAHQLGAELCKRHNRSHLAPVILTPYRSVIGQREDKNLKLTQRYFNATLNKPGDAHCQSGAYFYVSMLEEALTLNNESHPMETIGL